MDPALDTHHSDTEADSDHQLALSARAGDLQAFDGLVRQHYPRVYRVLRRLLDRAEDAEDAAQEVMIAAWIQLPRCRGEASFTTWLHSVTVRRGFSTARRESRRRMAPLDESEAGEMRADSAAELSQVAERQNGSDRLRRAVERLPEQQRIVATLYYYGEVSCRQIAEELGIQESTVRGQLRRARETLRRLLPDLREDHR